MHPEENIILQKNPEIEDFNVEISREKTEDISGINTVLYETWLNTYPNEKIGVTKEDIEEMFIKRNTAADIKRREVKSKRANQNSHTFVAKHNGQIVGCANFVQGPEYDQLKMLYILPRFQGKKVAFKLWTEIQKLSRKDKTVKVEVATYNNKAIAFYEKLGFKDTGKRFEDPTFTMPISKKVIPQMEMSLTV